MGYGFGYGPLRSLAVLLLRPAEPSSLALPYLSAHRLGGAFVSTVYNIREGRLRHQVVAVVVARNQYKNRINCYAWVWGGPRAI
jgi:hypothetical protein